MIYKYTPTGQVVEVQEVRWSRAPYPRGVKRVPRNMRLPGTYWVETDAGPVMAMDGEFVVTFPGGSRRVVSKNMLETEHYQYLAENFAEYHSNGHDPY